MSGVALLLQVVIVAAGVAVLLSRWPRLVGLWWALVALGVLATLAQFPPQGTVLVLTRPVHLAEVLAWGRLSLQLDMTAREGLRMVFVFLALWGGVAPILPEWGRGLAWFGPALLAGVLALTTTSFWALGWALAVWAGLALLPAFGGHLAGTRPVWQWLAPWLLPALALFSLLIWPDPNRVAPEPWRVQVLALALLAWVALAPLHVGLVKVTASARPSAAVWVWWTHTVVVLVAMRRLGFEPGLDSAVWRAAAVLQFLAVVTLVWAGAAALTARHVGRLAAYAALYNWALSLALWLAAPENEALVRWTLTTRFVSLNAVGMGLAALLRGSNGRQVEALSGWARRRPWSVALWGVGVASLAGAPFTPGIWTQWMVHRVPVGDLPLAWAAVLGALGVMGGLARALVTLWGPLREPLLLREEGPGQAVLWALSVGIILLGLAPQALVHIGNWLW